MERIAIIEEKEVNRVTELFIDKINGRYEFVGYTISNQIIEKPSKDILDVFDLFVLGANRKELPSQDGFERILDVDTDLIHYFKDGREDVLALLLNNGRCANRTYKGYKPYKGKKNQIRQYIFSKLPLALSIIYFNIGLLSAAIAVKNARIVIGGQRIDIMDGISFVCDFADEDRFKKDLEAGDIRNYIYESNNLSPRVKDFLWNQELVEDVLPYYQGTFLEISTKIRHRNIDLSQNLGIIDDGLEGEYRYDHILRVLNFDEDAEYSDEDYLTLAHEYVHLLQSNTGYPFLIESSAEIIAREYFGNTALSNARSAYSRACKYSKVFMEIVGPKAVWENVFSPNSTSLENSMKVLLSEEDYKEFIAIMNLHPYYDIEKLGELYPRLEEILDIAYKNKYGISMYEDGLVRTILEGGVYNRVYFRSDLRKNGQDYYESTSISLKEAVEQGKVTIVNSEYEIIAYDDYKVAPNKKVYTFITEPGTMVVEELDKLVYASPKKYTVRPVNIKTGDSYDMGERIIG